MIELLRELVRTQPSDSHIVDFVRRFYQAAAESEAPLYALIVPALDELRAALEEEQLGFDREDTRIVSSSLLLAAEVLATDGFAKGRRSQRRSDLRQAVEAWIIEHEKRSRQNGWSYLQQLTGHLAKPVKRTKDSKQEERRRIDAVLASLGTQRPRTARPKTARRTDIPSYDGLSRYAATEAELGTVGHDTLDALVEEANALSLGQGGWPVTREEFPSSRAKFKRILNMVKRMRAKNAKEQT